MATRSPAEKRLIMIGIPVVGVIAAYLIFTPPPGQTGQKGLLSTADATKKLADAKKENAQILAGENKMEPEIAKLSYTMPAEQLVPRVIRDLQTIADKSGVHLREIKPIRGKVLKSNAGVRVPVEVRFKSSFQPDAMRFLYHVEESDKRMVVDKINISSADPKFKTVEVSATITVFTTSLVGYTGGEGDNSNASNKTNRG